MTSMHSHAACPVCLDQRNVRFVETCEQYDLLHCNSCDLSFSNPMKSGASAWYNQSYFIRHVAVDDRLMWYFSWAMKHLPAKGKLLDVACGTGAFVFYARQHGFDAYGIDFSAEAVEAGKERFGLETIFTVSLEEYRAQHPGEKFDVVTLFEVLEHVESPTCFLREVKDILRPGGYIILSVPNRDRWPIRDFADYPPNHLTRWTRRSMKQLLDVSELEILQLRVTPVSLSINLFFGYFLRVLLYRLVNHYGRGLHATTEPHVLKGGMKKKWVGRRLSQLRRARDAFMWLPTVLLFPVLYHLFDGYNVISLVRKRV